MLSLEGEYVLCFVLVLSLEGEYVLCFVLVLSLGRNILCHIACNLRLVRVLLGVSGFVNASPRSLLCVLALSFSHAVLKDGYTLSDRVLRPADVGVSKKP